MFDSESSYKNFLIGVAIGGSLGALLFTTKKGKHVQKDILRKYHLVSNKAHHFLKDGIDALTLHSTPKQIAKRMTKKAHHFIKDGIERLTSPSKPKRKTHSTAKRKTKTKKKKR